MQPSLSADGTLTFTPSAEADGVAGVWLVLQDDGGTEHDGWDMSFVHYFTITVEGIPSVGIDDAAGDESAGTLMFTIWLSHAASAPLIVSWQTQDGDATAGADYLAASGTIEFAPGEVSKQVTIYLLDDDVDEEDAESFTAAITAAFAESTVGNVEASITVPAATGTIHDDDEPPAIEITSASTDEASGIAEISVWLVGNTSRTVSVDYVTVNGTARAFYDYSGTGGTIEFAPGEFFKQISIPIVDDYEIEGAEGFSLAFIRAGSTR